MKVWVDVSLQQRRVQINDVVKNINRLHAAVKVALEEVFGNLTRNQARAIEQYFIVNGPNLLNKINSISPDSEFYNEALKWAEEFITSLH